MKEILKKNKMLIALVVTIITTFFVVVAIALHLDAKYRSEQMLKQYPFEVMKHEAVLSYYEYKSQLVKEVKAYIDSVAPTSALNGYAIVDCCEKYDLDIKFVLAQGQIESHFGTTGMATKTNSVFNVGAYDKTAYECINGKYKYLHPDNSIEPYMQLLYSNYITGTKNELDLMAKFVDKYGKKYSSNPNYEKALFDLYNKIDKSTNITELQGEMRRYKIISGV